MLDSFTQHILLIITFEVLSGQNPKPLPVLAGTDGQQCMLCLPSAPWPPLKNLSP